ncbi:hypothetical protein Glove_658g29 [Diversispora epigaea]|uniref:HMG box domain-containing protein n=1 Tax=Diversispora epigaea TaxID=1348612 RepID=A0A397G434_9GLOM|nr:hypothetical protein Glove_658g29 [Diversispora epigaea]
MKTGILFDNSSSVFRNFQPVDDYLKSEVDNFVTQVNLEHFWNWCLLNRESPILPKPRENGNIPRVANPYFQFKRFVARYALEHEINGYNNQIVLSKSQSILWRMISNEQRIFFKNLYSEALEFVRKNYPDYTFHPRKQKSEPKIKPMGKKSKVAVVENRYEQIFNANRNDNLGVAHINKPFRMQSETAEGGKSDCQHNFEGFNHCLKSFDGGTDKMEDYSNNNKDRNDHYHDNERNETNDHILISSQANANIADVNSPHAFQNFKISASLWAKVDPLPNKRNDLKFSININDFGAGPMLSDNWPSLRKLGIGYFLDSVEIWAIPIESGSMPNKPLYKVKDGPWPQQFSKDGYISEVLEQSFNPTTEWKLIVDGCGITGLGWRYQYSANSPFKNLDDRRRFAPGEHSCKWRTFEAMSGFRITITQVLRCEITDCWYNPIKRSKSKLKKLCPKIAHTLEISFNSLENFNENFENLKNSEKLHGGDFLNVTFSKNVSPQIENSKNSNIGNIEIKRSLTMVKNF